jgi:fructose-1,6-bisphosphatase I
MAVMHQNEARRLTLSLLTRSLATQIRVPDRGKIYSFNEGNTEYFHPETKAYLDSIKHPKGEGKKPYSARYIGSMVADVHRTLLYGGIFGYPGDTKTKSGKLRILYEAFRASTMPVVALAR